MEDPATRLSGDSGPAHRAVRGRRPDDGGRGRSRLGTAAVIAVPTTILVAVAATLAGGATAATGLFSGGNASGTGNVANVRTSRIPIARNAIQGRLRRPVMPPPRVIGSPPPADPNANCTLIVPANPLSARGLATPYQLTATNPAMGPCNEANPNQSAFVQGAILTPGGQLTLYDPLVIDRGTTPAARTAAAQVPAGSTVALWFGFNGDNLTLRSARRTNALAAGRCVNGMRRSIFGQFASCNGTAFFRRANGLIAQNLLQVPGAGMASDGLPCPTVRDFSLVDQDQSDNVTTHYLANANGQTAQNNAAARAVLGANPVDLANGSDNLLLTAFVLPALGCQPWTAPDGANDGAAMSSLPLDELSAAANQAAPVALLPLNNPMDQVNGASSITKTNLFRAAVNQMPIGAGGDNGDGATYCQNLFNNPMGIQRNFTDMAILSNAPSPDPAAASNLFAFLAMRGQGSFENLGCGALVNQANPITVTLTNGIVTAATFGAAAQAAPATSATPTATVPAAGTVTATAIATATTPAAPMPTSTAMAPTMPAATQPLAPATTAAAGNG